jgi:hypothetical protein
MIAVTSNAAISVAFRNAVLKLIPRAFTERIYQAAQAASVGKGTLEQKRTKALDYFSQNGYEQERVYALLGVRGYDDLSIEHIITLRGFVNAIREGETTLEELFNPQAPISEEAAKLDEALSGQAPKAEPKGKAKKASKKDEPDPIVTEAASKATAKAEALAKAGALDMDKSVALEGATAACDLEALIALDTEFKRLMEVHGVEE